MTLLPWLVACSAPVLPVVPDDTAAPVVTDDVPEPEAEPETPTEPPSTGATADTGTPPGIDVGLFGTCEPLPADPDLLPGTRLVGTYYPTVEATFASQVFTDVETYARFLAEFGIVGNFIDFGVEHAAVFGYGGDTSCGFLLDGWDAVDLGGTPTVVVRVDDSSWGCDMGCSGAPSEVWVFAFPRAAVPLTCLRVGGGCGPLP